MITESRAEPNRDRIAANWGRIEPLATTFLLRPRRRHGRRDSLRVPEIRLAVRLRTIRTGVDRQPMPWLTGGIQAQSLSMQTGLSAGRNCRDSEIDQRTTAKLSQLVRRFRVGRSSWSDLVFSSPSLWVWSFPTRRRRVGPDCSGVPLRALAMSISRCLMS